MKNLFTLLLIAIVMGCSNDDKDTDKPVVGFNIDATIDFKIENKDGSDLLNPDNPNALDLYNLHLYNIIDGKEVEIYNPLLASPKGFVLLKPEPILNITEYRLRIFANIEDKATITSLCLKWADGSKDIIKSNIDRGDGYIIATKHWYNDVLFYDVKNSIDLGGQGYASYKIVK